MTWDDQSGKHAKPHATTSNPSIPSAQQPRTQKKSGGLAGEQDGSVGNRWSSCGAGHPFTFLIDVGEKRMSGNVHTIVYWVGKFFSSQRMCVYIRRTSAREHTKQKNRARPRHYGSRAKILFSCSFFLYLQLCAFTYARTDHPWVAIRTVTLCTHRCGPVFVDF